MHDEIKAQLFHTNFCAGICKWDETMNALTLIELAEKAMYQAKKSGRNRVIISQRN